jgi:uncharacterized Zn finger protein
MATIEEIYACPLCHMRDKCEEMQTRSTKYWQRCNRCDHFFAVTHIVARDDTARIPAGTGERLTRR